MQRNADLLCRRLLQQHCKRRQAFCGSTRFFPRGTSGERYGCIASAAKTSIVTEGGFAWAHTALLFIRDFNPAFRFTVSVSSRRIAIVLSGIITWSFPHFCIVYVDFGGASDPLAYNSAPLITLPEDGVGLSV
ncbi:hypothetical protein MRX96_038976 [Rhipicephalus microplus]